LLESVAIISLSGLVWASAPAVAGAATFIQSRQSK
jgi:hypothetical protein